MSILYPVAISADQALQSPKGVAARQREAENLAGGAVEFVTEAVGPAFATQDALLDTLKAASAQPWCAPRPIARGEKARTPVKPVNADGRRWPLPQSVEPTLWRLSVSYWRIAGDDYVPADHARNLRRDPEAGALDAKALRALAHQPLRPVKPQQPLDIGLFEIRLADQPHIVMPDE